MPQQSLTPLQPDYPGLPLIVGVTGHRDLIAEEIPLLEDTAGLRFRAVSEAASQHSPDAYVCPG